MTKTNIAVYFATVACVWLTFNRFLSRAYKAAFIHLVIYFIISCCSTVDSNGHHLQKATFFQASDSILVNLIERLRNDP